MGATVTVSLTPNPAGPQPVGTSITWTAMVTDSQAGAHSYRFSVQAAGGRVQIRKDFSTQNTWRWTPSDFEETFRIAVTARNLTFGTVGSSSVVYQIVSRVVSGRASVSPTNHRLVALFSAPPCLRPNSMRVRFRRTAESSSQVTHLVPCRAITGVPSPNLTSMNFYVAGMYASSTYLMNWETIDPNGATCTGMCCGTTLISV